MSTVASSKEVVGSVIATGEFTLTVPANSFVAYDPAKCLPKAQMTDKVMEENILKAFTASTSHLLTEFGVINDFDDLVKMVLKERAKKRKEDKKQMAVA